MNLHRFNIEGDEKMKRVVVFILTIIMAFSLTACCAFIKPEKTTETIKPAHTNSYAQKVCSGCDEEDSTHAYEYLVMWLKENGTQTGGEFACSLATTEDSLDNLAIVYDTSKDYVYICSLAKINESTHSLLISLENYSFMFSVDENSIVGIVAASKYTKYEGELHVLQSECVNLQSDECIALAKIETSILLDGLSEFLEHKNLGITLADLGFDSYESENTYP